MNYFSQQKWLKIAVALLIVLNLSVIGILVMARRSAGPPPPMLHHPGERPKYFVIKELHLSDEQIKAYELLIDEHQFKIKELKSSLIEKKVTYFQGLGVEDQSVAQVELDKIIAVQKQFEEVTYQHFKDFRKILTDEQKLRFDKILGETIKMMVATDAAGLGRPPHP